jgi:Mn2+/Fe2+ NRAMP family transporter
MVTQAAPWWKRLGAGVITGAADDDPGGIATCSQVGAKFGYGILWRVLLALPLMIGIQAISALVGRVTGAGLAENLRHHQPLGGHRRDRCRDGIAAGWPRSPVRGNGRGAVGAAAGVRALNRYMPILKVLTFSLFTYVATVLMIRVPWRR